MSDDEELLTMEFMERQPELHYCKPGYSNFLWPSCMYISGRDGDAYLWVSDRAVVSLKTRGDLRRLLLALGLKTD